MDRFIFLAEACRKPESDCLSHILNTLSAEHLFRACSVSRGWRLAGVATEVYERTVLLDLSPSVAKAWMGEGGKQPVIGDKEAASFVDLQKAAPGIYFEGKEELQARLLELQVILCSECSEGSERAQ